MTNSIMENMMIWTKQWL